MGTNGGGNDRWREGKKVGKRERGGRVRVHESGRGGIGRRGDT